MNDEREQRWRRDLAAARRGDEAAYRRFLTEAAAQLRGFARAGLSRAGRGAAEAEDIVQETLIALHTRRHTWDETQGVTPWLYAIARHKLIDQLRRRTGHDHLALDDLAETLPEPAPEKALPDMDLPRLMGALPDKQARIVRGMVLEGRRAAEVGAELGMADGAVRVALHRALKALAMRFGTEKA